MNSALEREILADVAEIKERIQSALEVMLDAVDRDFRVWAENTTWRALRDARNILEHAQRQAGVELPEPETFASPGRSRRVSESPGGVQ